MAMEPRPFQAREATHQKTMKPTIPPNIAPPTFRCVMSWCLTCPVTGARRPTHAHGGTSARVRVDRGVRRLHARRGSDMTDAFASCGS
jgi:hypothetical protein